MMKIPTKLIALLSGAALLTASGHADSVSTDPVGYVTTDLPVGASLVTAPLLGSVQYSGSAGVINGLDLNISNLPELISSSSFVHVTSGNAVGATATIVSSNATSVTLESSVTGLLEGDSIRIVEHFTLADLTSASANSIPDGSGVTVYNSDGSSDSYTTYTNVWYDAGFSSADDVVVFPGEGFVMNLQSSTSFVFVGNVNTKQLNVSVASGAVNIVGSINPSTPAGSGSIGSALASSLDDGSTLTLYSNDGFLTTGESYTCYSGVWYDAGFSPTEISIASPSVAVVSPQENSEVLMPAAY